MTDKPTREAEIFVSESASVSQLLHAESWQHCWPLLFASVLKKQGLRRLASTTRCTSVYDQSCTAIEIFRKHGERVCPRATPRPNVGEDTILTQHVLTNLLFTSARMHSTPGLSRWGHQEQRGGSHAFTNPLFRQYYAIRSTRVNNQQAVKRRTIYYMMPPQRSA